MSMTTVFIISAPSGSGKSTLVGELRRLVPGLRFSVSYTTRAPRGQEREGQEYLFISRDEFDAERHDLALAIQAFLHTNHDLAYTPTRSYLS